MTICKEIQDYVDLILKNKIEHCEEQRLMIVNNVLPALARDDVYLDMKKIEDGLKLQKYFSFELFVWEKFLFALIAGLHFDDGRIYFNVIDILVGRGAGKNGLIDFLILYFLSPYHGVKGYNVDLLANSENQAKVSFDDLYNLITEPDDKSHLKILSNHFYATKQQIVGKKTKSILRFNTSSKRGKDSKRTGCAIFDEKHEYLEFTQMNTLLSGLGKIENGRAISISTDGHIRGGVLDKEKAIFRRILSKYNPSNRRLVFWCRLEKEEEWNDPSKWIKANPSVNEFPSMREKIAQEVEDMSDTPDYYPEFMAKRMNFPVGDKDVEVAKWEDIVACNNELESLVGKSCVGILDYAKTDDFVVVGLLFKINGRYKLIHHTFVCKKSRDLIAIKAPLAEWEAMGHLEFVDDVEISPDYVVNWFAEQGAIYNIKRIAIDNYRYSVMNFALKKIGFDAFERKNVKLVRPSDIMKVAPLINTVFVRRLLDWGISPIMNWYTNNTKKVQINGNITYGKIEEKSRKTDGFSGLVNGFVIAEDLEEQKIEIPAFVETITF